jgi:uncharacterized protein YndB with AHSA1/START domain
MDTKENKVIEPALLTISRVFDAPCDLVWKACTRPERMTHWWGPKGSIVRVAKMDFRVGGSYHCCMESPHGQTIWGKFVYREIVEPQRIVFVNSFSDENGGLTRHPLVPTWPLEMLSTFIFTEHEGKTTFTIQWTPVTPTEAELKAFVDGMDSMKQGWTGTLDQLTDYLAELKK